MVQSIRFKSLLLNKPHAIIDLLYFGQAGESAALAAAANGHSDTLCLLLDRGADVNNVDSVRDVTVIGFDLLPILHVLSSIRSIRLRRGISLLLDILMARHHGQVCFYKRISITIEEFKAATSSLTLRMIERKHSRVDIKKGVKIFLQRHTDRRMNKPALQHWFRKI